MDIFVVHFYCSLLLIKLIKSPLQANYSVLYCVVGKFLNTTLQGLTYLSEIPVKIIGATTYIRFFVFNVLRYRHHRLLHNDPVKLSDLTDKH